MTKEPGTRPLVAIAPLGAWLLGFAACQAPAPARVPTPKQPAATKAPATTPRPPEKPHIASIALGDRHTCALLSNGAVRCWGNGTYGALGYATAASVGDDEGAVAAADVPIRAPVKALNTGGVHACVLLEEGRVRCWGPWYSLGFARPAGSSSIIDNSFSGPTDIDVGQAVAELAAGSSHTCARTLNGTIRCWGRNGEGQLGYGTSFKNDSGLPPRVLGDVPVGGVARRIWAGGNGTCALLENGSLSCWGEPWVSYSRDRTQRLESQSTPAVVDVGGVPKQIVFGDDTACALLEDGSVRCWGTVMDLGYGHMGYSPLKTIGEDEPPSAVRPLEVGGKAVALAAGAAHTCALLEEGTVRCWGKAEYGALGYGNRVDIGDDEAPAKAGNVPVGGKAVQIAAGGFHTCALLDTGSVRCWGSGEGGELGYGNTDSIGDDESPEEAGDVPLFTSPRPRDAGPRKPRRVASTKEVPFLWEAPATGAPQAECGEPCAGCKVLYDSSKRPKHSAVSLTPVEEGRVLDVYRQYINSDHCLTDELHLDPLAVGSAQDRGSMSDVIAGSFTEPGRKQKLVLLFAGHCGEMGAHSENWGQRLLILLENETALRASVDASSTSLLAVDVDNDGRTEFVTWGGRVGGGGSSSWLGLQSYAGGVQTLLGGFWDVDSSTCFPGVLDGEAIAAKVLYHANVATRALCFQVRKRASACPKQ